MVADGLIAAITTRVAAFEIALAALAQSPEVDHNRVLQSFDMFAVTLEAKYMHRPISDDHVDRPRASLADIRKLLE